MSMYGPPGGPYPGQPQDPWQGGGQPQDHYGQPSYDPGYGQPAYNPPQYGQPGYQPGGDMWGPPAAPQSKKGGSGLLITVIVVLAVLLCGGGAVTVYLVTQKSGNPAANPSTSAATSTGATPTTGPSSEPTTEPTTAPTTAGNTNGALDAHKGDCLVNDGTGDKPKMRKVERGPNTFEVLKRIEGTSDVNKCNGTPGYTHNYFYKSTIDSLSFVLCMKQRKS